MLVVVVCVSMCLWYLNVCIVFFFKQKTAYEMRISDWSSDVCSSDLLLVIHRVGAQIPGQHKIVIIHRTAQLFGKLFGVMQIGDADTTTRHLVFVCRANTTASGADRVAAGGQIGRAHV